MSKKQDIPPTEKDTPLEFVENETATQKAAEAEASDSASDTASDVEPVAKPEAAPAPVDPAKELQEQLLRLRADFENFRKRTRKEKEEWTQRSLEHVFEDLLTVLDHFELGIKNAEDMKVTPEVVQGFSMVQHQLKSILGKWGLSAVDADGQKFDPSLHEAISQVPSPEIPADHVLAMTRRGYKLGERLLRPAQVVVSQGPPEEAVAETDAASDEKNPDEVSATSGEET